MESTYPREVFLKLFEHTVNGWVDIKNKELL